MALTFIGRDSKSASFLHQLLKSIFFVFFVFKLLERAILLKNFIDLLDFSVTFLAVARHLLTYLKIII